MTGVNVVKGIVYTNNPWGISGQQSYKEFIQNYVGVVEKGGCLTTASACIDRRTMMKGKLLVLICMFLLLSGCTKGDSKVQYFFDDSSNTSQVPNKITDNSGSETDAVPMEDVEIYQISREVFFEILEKNTVYDLTDNSSKRYSYISGEKYYITSRNTLFKVTRELTNFIGSNTALQIYLAEKKIEGRIENVVVFDAPYVPLTVWIQTDTETVYVTINESYEDVGYVYRLYRQMDYYDKFKRRDAQLILDGIEITNAKSIKLYYGYADIPFTAICFGLGAKVSWESESQAIIRFTDKTYMLDVAHDRLHEENDKTNLLHSMTGGGPYYKYMQDGEFYMDSNTLECVLQQMGKKVNIFCDAENNMVVITSH